MKVAQRYKKETDLLKDWMPSLSEVKVALLKNNKYFGKDALQKKCDKMSKMCTIFADQFRECDFNVILALLSGLHVLDKDDFYSIVKKTIPSASNDYLDEKWSFFMSMPMQYIYTRSPKAQGERLLIFILKCGGFDGTGIQSSNE